MSCSDADAMRLESLFSQLDVNPTTMGATATTEQSQQILAAVHLLRRANNHASERAEEAMSLSAALDTHARQVDGMTQLRKLLSMTPPPIDAILDSNVWTLVDYFLDPSLVLCEGFHSSSSTSTNRHLHQPQQQYPYSGGGNSNYHRSSYYFVLKNSREMLFEASWVALNLLSGDARQCAKIAFTTSLMHTLSEKILSNPFVAIATREHAAWAISNFMGTDHAHRLLCITELNMIPKTLTFLYQALDVFQHGLKFKSLMDFTIQKRVFFAEKEREMTMENSGRQPTPARRRNTLISSLFSCHNLFFSSSSSPSSTADQSVSSPPLSGASAAAAATGGATIVTIDADDFSRALFLRLGSMLPKFQNCVDYLHSLTSSQRIFFHFLTRAYLFSGADRYILKQLKYFHEWGCEMDIEEDEERKKTTEPDQLQQQHTQQQPPNTAVPASSSSHSLLSSLQGGAFQFTNKLMQEMCLPSEVNVLQKHFHTHWMDFERTAMTYLQSVITNILFAAPPQDPRKEALTSFINTFCSQWENLFFSLPLEAEAGGEGHNNESSSSFFSDLWMEHQWATLDNQTQAQLMQHVHGALAVLMSRSNNNNGDEAIDEEDEEEEEEERRDDDVAMSLSAFLECEWVKKPHAGKLCLTAIHNGVWALSNAVRAQELPSSAVLSEARQWRDYHIRQQQQQQQNNTLGVGGGGGGHHGSNFCDAFIALLESPLCDPPDTPNGTLTLRHTSRPEAQADGTTTGNNNNMKSNKMYPSLACIRPILPCLVDLVDLPSEEIRNDIFFVLEGALEILTASSSTGESPQSLNNQQQQQPQIHNQYRFSRFSVPPSEVSDTILFEDTAKYFGSQLHYFEDEANNVSPTDLARFERDHQFLFFAQVPREASAGGGGSSSNNNESVDGQQTILEEHASMIHTLYYYFAARSNPMAAAAAVAAAACRHTANRPASPRGLLKTLQFLENVISYSSLGQQKTFSTTSLRDILTQYSERAVSLALEDLLFSSNVFVRINDMASPQTLVDPFQVIITHELKLPALFERFTARLIKSAPIFTNEIQPRLLNWLSAPQTLDASSSGSFFTSNPPLFSPFVSTFQHPRQSPPLTVQGAEAVEALIVLFLSSLLIEKTPQNASNQARFWASARQLYGHRYDSLQQAQTRIADALLSNPQLLVIWRQNNGLAWGREEGGDDGVEDDDPVHLQEREIVNELLQFWSLNPTLTPVEIAMTTRNCCNATIPGGWRFPEYFCHNIQEVQEGNKSLHGSVYRYFRFVKMMLHMMSLSTPAMMMKRASLGNANTGTNSTRWDGRHEGICQSPQPLSHLTFWSKDTHQSHQSQQQQQQQQNGGGCCRRCPKIQFMEQELTGLFHLLTAVRTITNDLLLRCHFDLDSLCEAFREQEWTLLQKQQQQEFSATTTATTTTKSDFLLYFISLFNRRNPAPSHMEAALHTSVFANGLHFLQGNIIPLFNQLFLRAVFPSISLQKATLQHLHNMSSSRHEIFFETFSKIFLSENIHSFDLFYGFGDKKTHSLTGGQSGASSSSMIENAFLRSALESCGVVTEKSIFSNLADHSLVRNNRNSSTHGSSLFKRERPPFLGNFQTPSPSLGQLQMFLLNTALLHLQTFHAVAQQLEASLFFPGICARLHSHATHEEESFEISPFASLSMHVDHLRVAVLLILSQGGNDMSVDEVSLVREQVTCALECCERFVGHLIPQAITAISNCCPGLLEAVCNLLEPVYSAALTSLNASRTNSNSNGGALSLMSALENSHHFINTIFYTHCQNEAEKQNVEWLLESYFTVVTTLEHIILFLFETRRMLLPDHRSSAAFLRLHGRVLTLTVPVPPHVKRLWDLLSTEATH